MSQLAIRATQDGPFSSDHLCYKLTLQILNSKAMPHLFCPEPDCARKKAGDDRGPPHQEGPVLLGAQGLHGQGLLHKEQGRRRLRGMVLAGRLLLPGLPQRRRQAVLCGAVQAGKLSGNEPGKFGKASYYTTVSSFEYHFTRLSCRMFSPGTT